MTICPYCNYEATNHETLDEEKNPVTGDISFCINCGETGLFTFAGVIEIDIDDLTEETKQEIQKIKDAWLQTRHLSFHKEETDKS